MSNRTNPITIAGYRALREQHRLLIEVERPAIVDIVSWAAGNGDRSENGDYIYGRMKLRDIDRQLRRLSQQIRDAKPIDPARQEDRTRVRFGAQVTLIDENDVRVSYQIVGDDESDAAEHRIGWSSPLARAIRGAAVGDVRHVVLPGGTRGWEIVAIGYPDSNAQVNIC